MAVPRPRTTPGAQFLHGRLWQDPIEGPPAPFSVTPHSPPVDALDDEFPIRLTTGRRLESYNTGAQSGLYRSPLHRGESLDLSPEDAAELDLHDGEIALVRSRRGSVGAPVRIDRSLRRGLAFMTFHFPEQVETNVLTIDATDPKSGTAEFKAAAIAVEKLPIRRRSRTAAVAAERRSGPATATVRPATATARVSHGRRADGPEAARRRGDRRRAQAVDELLGPAVAGSAARARRARSTGASPTAVTRRATSATGCCRRCRPSRPGSAGSATAR